MLLFLLLVIVFSLVGVRFAGANEFHSDYLSKESTAAVNGSFVLLVFLKHACDQATVSQGVFDKPYLAFGEGFGQLIVTSFLFYSGYGITLSVLKKGMSYVRAIPKNRFLKVLLHFDLAVVLFIGLNLILKIDMKPLDILLSLVGWSNVGNSNWYIFSILALYLIVFVSFTVFKGRKYPSLIMSLALIFGFIVLMFAVRRPAYYYNTLVCFGLGMVFGAFKDRIDGFVMKSDFSYFFILALVGVSFFFSNQCAHLKTFPHSLWATLFTLLLVLITMKVQLKNNLLTYFGNRVFSFYVLQRIPMIIFKRVPLIYENAYIYVFVCFLCTLFAVTLFEMLTNVIDKELFSTK